MYDLLNIMRPPRRPLAGGGLRRRRNYCSNTKFTNVYNAWFRRSKLFTTLSLEEALSRTVYNA